MRKIIVLIISLSFAAGCRYGDEDEAMRLLREAVSSSGSDRSATYQGTSIVRVWDDISYRMPATLLSDGARSVSSSQASATGNDIIVPLRELPSAAVSAEIDNRLRKRGMTAVRVNIDPVRAKDSVNVYFASRLAEIREQVSADRQPNSNRMNILAKEENALNEMLESMEVQAEYTVWIRRQDKRIDAIDAVTRIRYTRDGKSVEETVHGMYKNIKEAE